MEILQKLPNRIDFLSFVEENSDNLCIKMMQL